jgi:UDP-4-amino-4,6-dideoxy-N-acetyl-beta-L-altrosamine transaminase
MTYDGAFLPYGRHAIDDDDVKAVSEVLRGDWLTGGPTVERFERAFAATTDAVHAVACANGTAALHLAALALDVDAADTVVVPSVTFLASANAFRFEDATIVFADVDPATGLMTPETLDDALDGIPKGGRRVVVPVHLGGRCHAPHEIAAVARRHGAVIVEDACHALGSTYRQPDGTVRCVGACADSDMAVFSLHPVKTIAMGEGGVVTTSDEKLAQRLRLFRNHGMTRRAEDFQNTDLARGPDGSPNPWYYEMTAPAPNYRASDINCALGLSQLRKLARFAERRRALAARYDRLLAPLAPAVRPNAAAAGCDPVLHLYSVRIDFDAIGMDRGTLMRRLHANGIGTQVHYIPVHLQPYYRGAQRRALPGAEAYYAGTLTLPLFPEMADQDTERVVGVLAKLLGLGAQAA